MTSLGKLVTLCQKHAQTDADFIQLLVRWMDVAREVATAPNGLNARAQVLCYLTKSPTTSPASRSRTSSNASSDPKPRKPS